MALADPATRTTVQSAHLRAIYGLFKGRAGDEDVLLLKNLVDRLVGVQAKTDPAAGTIALYIQDAAGADKYVQYYSGEQWIRTDTPYLRLKGTEASGVDLRMVESAGKWKLQHNTGSESTPTWSDRLVVDVATGNLETAGTYLGQMEPLVAAAYYGGL